MSSNVGIAQFLQSIGQAQFLQSIGKAQFLQSIGKAQFLQSIGKAQFLQLIGRAQLDLFCTLLFIGNSIHIADTRSLIRAFASLLSIL